MGAHHTLTVRSDCAHHSLCVRSFTIQVEKQNVSGTVLLLCQFSVDACFCNWYIFYQIFNLQILKKKQCLNFESFESSHHPVQKLNIQKLLECIYNQTVIWTLAGMNSIFMYIAHTTYQNYFPVGWKVEENHTQQLALHLWGPAFFCLFTYMMHRKKIYITIQNQCTCKYETPCIHILSPPNSLTCTHERLFLTL